MRSRGFTLIEVLLALTLTALICSVLYGVAVGTLRTERKIGGFNEAAVLAGRIGGLLRRDLRGIYLADYAGKDFFRATSHVRLGAPADRITFLTTAPPLVGEDPDETPGVEGVREVTYVALPSQTREGYLALWRREAPVDEDPFQGGRFVRLHDQVERFDLRFVGPEGELEWESAGEEWSGTDGQLPKAVLLDLVVSLGDPPERGGDPDRFRRYRLYQVVALPAGVTPESRKLQALLPRDARARAPGPGGPAAGPRGGPRGGQNPLLRNLRRGGMRPPRGGNPLLELLRRHGMGRRR